MLWAIATILMLLWVLGMFIYGTTGGLIHLFVAVAAGLVIVQAVRGRKIISVK
jgi:hypothetical protein